MIQVKMILNYKTIMYLIKNFTVFLRDKYCYNKNIEFVFYLNDKSEVVCIDSNDEKGEC